MERGTDGRDVNEGRFSDVRDAREGRDISVGRIFCCQRSGILEIERRGGRSAEAGVGVSRTGGVSVLYVDEGTDSDIETFFSGSQDEWFSVSVFSFDPKVSGLDV